MPAKAGVKPRSGGRSQKDAVQGRHQRAPARHLVPSRGWRIAPPPTIL